MIVRPDVAATDSDSPAVNHSTAVGTVAAPVECLIPMAEPVREAYLTIRRKDGKSDVTAIELLSPANKRPGADGYDQYLDERNHVLATSANLVELDLLRGGRRIPLLGKLPAGDFVATVSRSRRRPRAEAYVWSLEQPLPVIPIPLAECCSRGYRNNLTADDWGTHLHMQRPGVHWAKDWPSGRHMAYTALAQSAGDRTTKRLV